MTYLEVKVAYRAALDAIVARNENPAELPDDIWAAVSDRDYNEPMFDSPVPEGIAELAALISDNPAIGYQDVWDEGSETITVSNAMSNGVYLQLHEDLSADWLTIKTEAQVNP